MWPVYNIYIHLVSQPEPKFNNAIRHHPSGARDWGSSISYIICSFYYMLSWFYCFVFC